MEKFEPVKCPDCGVWWRGETHKCETVPTTDNHFKKEKDALVPWTKFWPADHYWTVKDRRPLSTYRAPKNPHLDIHQDFSLLVTCKGCGKVHTCRRATGPEYRHGD